MEFLGMTTLYPGEPATANFAANANEIAIEHGDVDGNDFYGRRAWLTVGPLRKAVARGQRTAPYPHGWVLTFRGSALLGYPDCDVHII